MAVTGTVGPPLMLTETVLSPPKPVVWPAQYRSACFGVPVKLTSIVPGWLKIVPAPPVAIPVPVASVTPTGAPSVSVPSASAPDEHKRATAAASAANAVHFLICSSLSVRNRANAPAIWRPHRQSSRGCSLGSTGRTARETRLTWPGA